jgi:hypothetical protein
MEPIGLAVGLLGLAGLFNTCLDVLEKVDSWKDFGSESRSLAAQFKAHKLRLEQWGQAVGFEQQGLLDEHSKLLDDPRTLSIVKELLFAIKNICGYDDNTLPQPAAGVDNKPIKDQIFIRHDHVHTPLESKRRKLSWALRNKAKRIAQVEQVASLVENLYCLVPINGERGTVSRYGESTSSNDPSRHPNGM